MAEIVRAHILEPGIIMDDRKQLETGQSFEFTDMHKFTSGDGGHLLVEGMTNGVWAKAWQREQHKIMPSSLSLSRNSNPRIVTVERTMNWGADPADGVQRNFGSPDTAMQAVFLGHSLREPLGQMMDVQSADYQQGRTLQFAGDYVDGILIFGGNVVRAEAISGINDNTANYNLRRGPKFAFPGEVMIGAHATLPNNDRQSTVTLFAATRSETDRLIRVNEAPDVAIYAETPDDTKSYAESLAKISVFAGTIAEEHPELTQHFPTLLVDHLHFGLPRDATGYVSTGRWKVLKEDNKIDWLAIEAGLPIDKVRTETDRITEVLFNATDHR